jgi:futalosine hydrolase
MRKVLIVAATYHEIQFLEKVGMKSIEVTNNLFSFIKSDTTFEVLIAGVGMVATAFHLTKQLSKNNYDLVLNVGIAGTFDKTIPLCETVNIIEDRFADLGAEDDENFISVFDLGLMDVNQFPFENGVLNNKTATELKPINDLKRVRGITVNKVHGNEKSIENLLVQVGHTERSRSAQTESMEGAAFAYVCMLMNVPHFQIRAISNYVEKRNRNAWKIEEALIILEKLILNIIDEISVSKQG